MRNLLLYYLARLQERLWVRPLFYCLLAVLAVFLARLADGMAPWPFAGEVSPDTTEKLLTVISSTMLAVATFAVGSMVSAYASAAGSGTPRVVALLLADDVSQNALSSFVGAFIFSIVAIIALRTDYYGQNGDLALFALTIGIFAWVIATFVRWVDNIARLGRLGDTIDKAEAAARRSLRRRRDSPHLGGRPWDGEAPSGAATLEADRIGYVQLVEMERLQRVAGELDGEIFVEALPGVFLSPGRPLAHVAAKADPDEDAWERIRSAFVVGPVRTFESDPRFGLIVLAEIAARALSPAVNDPGTAIAIIGRQLRLLAEWAEGPAEGAPPEPACDRVRVRALDPADLFDDAFTPIARDGAGMVEVGIRLQKAFLALQATGGEAMRRQARRHAALALARAEKALELPEDLAPIRELAKRSEREG